MKICEISAFIAQWPEVGIPLSAAWEVTDNCERLVITLLPGLEAGYRKQGDCAIHESAVVEAGAVLKGAVIIGPGAFVAAGAYLRGGVYIGRNCIVGPSCEVKSSFMFDSSKLAHFNFVGDSLIGAHVNIEAGAIIANYRNELDGAAIRIRHQGNVVETGVRKFGALVGDNCKIGANAVIAPGALLAPNTHVARLELVDQFDHR